MGPGPAWSGPLPGGILPPAGTPPRPRPMRCNAHAMTAPNPSSPSAAFDPEGALLVAYANGDRAAASELTAALVPRVLAQAMRMLGSRLEAEEVTQEAMLRL